MMTGANEDMNQNSTVFNKNNIKLGNLSENNQQNGSIKQKRNIFDDFFEQMFK